MLHYYYYSRRQFLNNIIPVKKKWVSIANPHRSNLRLLGQRTFRPPSCDILKQMSINFCYQNSLIYWNLIEQKRDPDILLWEVKNLQLCYFSYSTHSHRFEAIMQIRPGPSFFKSLEFHYTTSTMEDFPRLEQFMCVGPISLHWMIVNFRTMGFNLTEIYRIKWHVF